MVSGSYIIQLQSTEKEENIFILVYYLLGDYSMYVLFRILSILSFYGFILRKFNLTWIKKVGFHFVLFNNLKRLRIFLDV